MFNLPPGLKQLEQISAGREWLQHLPAQVQACVDRWSLRLDQPYEQSQVSIVFPATMADGSPAVLKVQFPHKESEHEAEALRRWNGQGAVKLFATDPEHHALLIERCEPGGHLSAVERTKALGVFAQILPRLWIEAGEPFVCVLDESAEWIKDLPLCWERAGRPFEVELLDAALEALDTVRRNPGQQVLIHQDLHGDNVLRAKREPWLVIDPKPLAGEREFSLAPIVRSHEFGHSREEAIHRLDWLTAVLRLDRERARLWSLGQTLAWACGDGHVLPRHVETARWLWQA